MFRNSTQNLPMAVSSGPASCNLIGSSAAVKATKGSRKPKGSWKKDCVPKLMFPELQSNASAKRFVKVSPEKKNDFAVKEA